MVDHGQPWSQRKEGPSQHQPGARAQNNPEGILAIVLRFQRASVYSPFPHFIFTAK